MGLLTMAILSPERAIVRLPTLMVLRPAPDAIAEVIRPAPMAVVHVVIPEPDTVVDVTGPVPDTAADEDRVAGDGDVAVAGAGDGEVADADGAGPAPDVVAEAVAEAAVQPQSSLPCRFCQVQSPCPMKTGLLAMATLPLPERATARLPTEMRLGQPQTPLPKRSRQDQSSWSRSCQNQPSSCVWPDHLQSPLPMKTGLLAMATLPLPEPATVILPTLMLLSQCQPPLPKRLRQRQSSSWLWSGHDQTPLLMKTGLLAMATFPSRSRSRRWSDCRQLIVLGRNQTPFSWLRFAASCRHAVMPEPVIVAEPVRPAPQSIG